MGLFLGLSGVVATDRQAVVDRLRDFAELRRGTLEEQPGLAIDDPSCLVVTETDAGVMALYPSGFLDWEDATRFLSRRLSTPAFGFHVHDGDLWLYVLFVDGEVVDQFNPLPEYWAELDDEERLSWRGDAEVVARCVPGLEPPQVSRYLQRWGGQVFGAAERTKAYSEDRFHYGDDWQLVDFTAKLGLEFPVDDDGSHRGATFRFECDSSFRP